MPAALLAGLILAPKFDFYAEGPYDRAVPRPESILGYGPGERTTTYRDQERVVDAMVAAAGARARKIVYGASVEGRPLRVVAISSPANIARLDAIRKEHEAIAGGKGDPAKTVPIVWINECIHGDETASFETGMWTLYTLLASRGDVAKALEKVVVILNPVYNPDGHERYTVYYNSIAAGSGAPDAFEGNVPSTALGRPNHYRFDMNRDRVAFSQSETRAEFAEMLRWGPQVYIDQHGQVASYFFPPEPMSVNPNVDRARNAKWTDRFGRATAKAFEARGLGYFTKEEFDFYYPGYIDTSTTLSGAIGMTQETDGGRRLAREREDGSTLTLTQGVFKHFTSALAVVKTAAASSGDLLSDYASFKRRAVSGDLAGKFKRVVMMGDPRELGRLKAHLAYAGIESRFAEAFSQPDTHDYWSDKTGKEEFARGSLVVDLAQSQGAMAKALLEPGQSFEAEFTKAQVDRFKGKKDPNAPDESEFYDITGWSLPYAYGVRAWWCESSPALPVEPARDTILPGFSPSSIGYALRYTDQEDVLAVADILLAGVRGGVTTKAMRLGDQDYPAGTFLFTAERNEEGYEKKILKALEGRGGLFLRDRQRLVPLTSAYPEGSRYSPGSGSVLSLRKPSLAVVMGTGTNLADSGAMWYLMDRVFKLPFTPLASSALSGGNLGRFTCVVLPSGTTASASGGFADWVRAGGVGVALDGGWAVGGAFTKLDERTGESLPGSLFRAELDPTSLLSYGYAAKTIAVPIDGGRFFKANDSAITLPNDKASLLLSGWEWPDDTEKALHGAAFLQDISLGRGRMVAFLGDPTARAMWPGLYKALLNAMILGGAQ